MNKFTTTFKKYKLPIFGVVCACLIFVHTQQVGAVVTTNTAGQNLTSGLVGWWTFDGKNMTSATATDMSGSGNNGTLGNGPTLIKGKIGQGLNFDGSNDYVSVPDVSAFSGSNVKTVSFWFKRNSLATNLPRLLEESSTANQSNYWAIGVPQTGNADENSILVTIVVGGVMSYRKIPNNSVNKLNTWYHAVVTWDGTSTLSSVYLNGAPQTMSAAGGYAGAGVVRMTIGNRGDNLRPFDGVLDDVRIYNRTLSASEVYALYKSQAGALAVSPTFTLTSGLVGWWTFDGKNMTSATATDMSGNGNNGTLTNGPTVAVGKIGQGLLLNGTNSYVNVPSLTWAPTAFTVAFWLNPRTCASYNQTIGGVSGWGTFIFHTTTACDVYVGTDITNRLTPTNLPANTITKNTWAHYAFTITGGTGKFYKNGVLLATKSGLSNSTAWGGFSIGKGTTDTINGSVDDVRVYNRALSATEVYALYKSQAGSLAVSPTLTLTSGLVGWWNFDGKNMTSATATDMSGNGNNGTRTNGPTVAMGKIGQGLSFVGASSQYVSVGTNLGITTNSNITISGWAYRASLGDHGAFFKLGNSSVGFGDGFGFGIGGTGTSGFETSGNRIIVLYEGIRWIDTGVTVGTGWHHYTLVINSSGKPTVYLDGVNVYSDSGTNGGAVGSVGTSVAQIGGYLSSVPSNRYFTGKLDDMRVYNRAISATEVYALYKLGAK